MKIDEEFRWRYVNVWSPIENAYPVLFFIWSRPEGVLKCFMSLLWVCTPKPKSEIARPPPEPLLPLKRHIREYGHSGKCPGDLEKFRERAVIRPVDGTWKNFRGLPSEALAMTLKKMSKYEGICGKCEGICRNMSKIWRNMKEYIENMKKHKEICRKYERIWRNMSTYWILHPPPPQIGSGTWKNSKLCLYRLWVLRKFLARVSSKVLGLVKIPSSLPFIYHIGAGTWKKFRSLPLYIGSGTWKNSDLFPST